MEKLAIVVRVSRSLAIKAGFAEAGEALFALTPSFLGSLTEAERAVVVSTRGEMGPHGHGYALDLDAPQVTEEAVRVALRREVAKAEAETARRKSEEERRAAELAEMVAEWEARARRDGPEAFINQYGASVWIDADLRSASKLVHETWEEAQRLIKERSEAERARQKAATEAAAAAREAADAALRAYALKVDHLARPAREGYEVRGATIAHIVARVIESANDVLVVYDTNGESCVLNGGASGEWAPRPAPRPESFEVLDTVRKGVENLLKSEDLPACVSVEVEEIQRWRKTKRDQWRTFVPVRVEVEALEAVRYVMFDADSTGDRYVMLDADSTGDDVEPME